MKKILIEDILFAFYGSVDMFSVETGNLAGNFLYPPDEYYASNLYYFEPKEYYPDDISLSSDWDKIQQIVNDNKDKYQDIKIVEDRCMDGYGSYRRIVGVREETDEEFLERVKKHEEKIEAKKKEKEKKKEQTLKNKKKMLAKLKEELGEQ